MRHSTAIAAVLACAISVPANAEESPDAPGTFGLGQIVVEGARQDDPGISLDTLDAEAMRTFQRQTLDDAVRLMPGVTASTSGGSRNEQLIYVRGFDRYQVPLSIDGIRVYLPADGRLDFGRFLTADIAQVQVAKGYASVLDGPGAMGGAINLVTTKPTKALEARAGGTLNLGRKAEYAGYNVHALLGTKQDLWYAQGSYTRNFQHHWDLPGSYAPTPGSAQERGRRDFSRQEDWRVNAKVGFTPNATDEYSLSYTRQEGAKNAPLHVTDGPSIQRNWTWPTWNLESIYFLSTTALGERASLKTRIFRNSFDNLLASYDDATQTTRTRGRSFDSWYADTAWGGSAQLDLEVSDRDTLSIAAHYRRDTHTEWQLSYASGVTEPHQTSREETYSLAAENRLELTPTLSLVTGISFDWRDLLQAEDYTDDAFVNYPLANGHALNGQGRLTWSPDSETSVHVSLSSRARFPTLAERFSSRFGGAVSNPDLKAERATHYEVGARRQLGPVELAGAVFYSDVRNAIVAFPMIYEGEAVSQSRNLGSGEYYGAEASAVAHLSSAFSLGGNYTWTHRDLDDPTNTAFQPTGVPTHKGFVWADWELLPGMHLLPNADIASSRWTVTTDGARYYRTGSYVLANLTARAEVREGLEISAGARNLFDDYYVLTDGFPARGRSFFIGLNAAY